MANNWMNQLIRILFYHIKSFVRLCAFISTLKIVPLGLNIHPHSSWQSPFYRQRYDTDVFMEWCVLKLCDWGGDVEIGQLPIQSCYVGCQ